VIGCPLTARILGAAMAIGRWIPHTHGPLTTGVLRGPIVFGRREGSSVGVWWRPDVGPDRVQWVRHV